MCSLEDSRWQQYNPPPVDETLKGFRIEMVFEFDLVDENGNLIEDKDKELCWRAGTVKDLCNGTWIKNGRETIVWKVGGGLGSYWG